MSGTIFFAFVGNWRVLDAFYFSATTLTTVGLGDPDSPPAPDLLDVLDVTLRFFGVTVLILLVGAAVLLTVLYLVQWLWTRRQYGKAHNKVLATQLLLGHQRASGLQPPDIESSRFRTAHLATLASIHWSAWKGYSRKFTCRIVHRLPSEGAEDGFWGRSHGVSEIYLHVVVVYEDSRT